MTGNSPTPGPASPLPPSDGMPADDEPTREQALILVKQLQRQLRIQKREHAVEVARVKEAYEETLCMVLVSHCIITVDW